VIARSSSSTEAGDVDFLARLEARFPEIAASVDNAVRGLVHLEMGIFASATQRAITAEDTLTVRRHFEFGGRMVPPTISRK
jgi:hypothetical protein